MKGGSEIGQNTLTRFFLFHVVILPFLAIVAISIHVYLIRTLGVSTLEFKGDINRTKKTFPFFPDHVYTELIIVTVVMSILITLALLFPVSLGERANPNITPLHIKPEWYFYPVFRWLKITNLEIGILGPILFIIILFLWPFIDRLLEKYFPEKEAGFWIGIAGLITINIFLLWEVFGH
jgi:ubiquinol-cytochrome c reductase cytochrome b subunit/cytochrome b6